MNASRDVEVSRVGFRAGTDEELTALHAVEAPIATETGSDRMPRQLDSYMAFARNLPSQFDDHAWLVTTSDGIPVAAAFCWSNSAGDPRVMECDVLVRADLRRRGIGKRLLLMICDETVRDGRSLLTGSTYDVVPAGAAFARRARARVARVNRTSQLIIADIDWTMIQGWLRPAPARALGYSLEMVDGPFPEHLRADAATLHRIMQTAPRENLDVGDVMIDTDFVAALDRSLAQAGRTRWTIFVRDAAGACVGGTEVTFEPDDSETLHQRNTGIALAHRGLGLAKWAKATMLERIRSERPEVGRIQTENAFSNAAMLAINDALGFRLIRTRTEWQGDAAALRRALG